MNIRKGDLVQVISGNDKGKRGKVLSVSREKNRAVVEGIRLIKRHTRPTRRDPQGGIVEREGTIHVSSLMVICPKTDQPTRIGKKKIEGGKYVRTSVRSGEMIDSK
jgi:large subunit ribosomal protein L24